MAASSLPPGLDPHRRLLETVGAGTPCVLITITEVVGSSPRGPGTQMLIEPDGTATGTVGGGVVEAAGVEAARAMLQPSAAGPAGAPGNETRILDLDTGCGGRVRLFLQRHGPARALVIAGAGHVGRRIATLAAGCGFAVDLIDTEATGSIPARIPGGGAYLIVATGAPEADVAWALAGLGAACEWIGVIGSHGKARAIAVAARAAGVPDGDLARLHCPVGLELGAETPEEIAISVLAELIRLTRIGAVPDSWRKGSPG